MSGCCSLQRGLSASWRAARHVAEISNGRSSLRIATGLFKKSPLPEKHGKLLGAMGKQRNEEKSADPIACAKKGLIKKPPV